MPLPAWTEPWLPHVAPLLIRLLRASWHCELRGVRYLRPNTPRLYAVWHGRQLALTAGLPAVLDHSQALVVMTSASRDGRIQSGILSRLGLETVTGSSSRYGDRALLQLARRVRGGASVVLAVDGPAGPVYCAKSGIGTLARLTGAPMVPVGVQCERIWTIPNTWDTFWVPAPGSAVAVRFGPPIVPPQRGHSALERAMDTLQRRMAALNNTRPRTLLDAAGW